MVVQPDETTLAAFEALLSDANTSEPEIQRFLEAHTEFLETPYLLNHRLNFNSIISKLPIGQWDTDFAYLTKSTVEWRLVLVELEHPNKSIFKESNKHDAFSADMNDAIAQINTWRDEWDKGKDGIQRAIRPLLQPSTMRENPISLRRVLVIGRDRELSARQSRKDRLAAVMSDNDIRILTYDSLIRVYKSGSAYKKCVLAQTARGFRIKNLDAMPDALFGFVGPSELEVSADAEAKLIANGYNMPAWRKGEMLVVNDRQPMSVSQTSGVLTSF